MIESVAAPGRTQFVHFGTGGDPEDWQLSGERFVPARMGGGVIEAEHFARYRFAMQWVAGKRVLDAGCGVGWGSQLLRTEGDADCVVGVDNFPAAIAYAQTYYAGPVFAVGDLVALPVLDNSFDVVVCFEALEHVQAHAQLMAEVRRVLRPDGILLISSPNPDVYPSGNPYHVHEARPGELVRSVSAEFPHVKLFAQELLLASLVSEPNCALDSITADRVGGAGSGAGQYSIVVASAVQLPGNLLSGLFLAGSDQLTDLDRLATTLQQDREALQGQATALAEEHRRLTAEAESAGAHAAELDRKVKDLHQQLVDADSSLHSLMSERDDAVTELSQRWDRQRMLGEEERDSSRSTIENLRLEVAKVRHDRDRVAVELLHSEQELANGGFDPESLETAELRAQVASMARSAALLADQVNNLRNSRSWRMTYPLRRVREWQIRYTRAGRT